MVILSILDRLIDCLAFWSICSNPKFTGSNLVWVFVVFLFFGVFFAVRVLFLSIIYKIKQTTKLYGGYFNMKMILNCPYNTESWDRWSNWDIQVSLMIRNILQIILHTAANDRKYWEYCVRSPQRRINLISCRLKTIRSRTFTHVWTYCMVYKVCLVVSHLL